MSSKIDDRIVNMKFNNSQFEKGVADTNKSLDALKKGLNLKDAGKGFADLAATAKTFSLDTLANGVESIVSKFSALSIIGITALANIANRAIDTGVVLLKSLTVDPIKAGLDEYELKMGSIQTILANTSRYGTTLNEVTASLDELNTYADLTIYNFGDMTKNIGLFTNAGIGIKDATSMIKGFSNEAAASGTTSQGAAGAAYQLSQALSAGTIRLMDWRSLTNVGMGNKNMQNGLIEIADAMGMLTAKSTSASEVQSDFNGSLEKSWLSADVMSTYLKIMAGDMTAAEQAALGLSDSQITAFKAQAQMAQDAATKVRTWTQLVGTMQEAVGSGWTETFDILIGNFDQATVLWTNVNNALGPIVDGMAKARNDLLRAWEQGGGRDSAISAVANAWKAAMAVLAPIKEAFQEIFPPLTAQKLIEITKAVESFTKSLMPSEQTLANIKSTAKGFFAVLDIGWMVLQQVVTLFGRLFKAIVPVGTGLLGVTGNLGDWLVAVRDAIKNGDGLAKVFDWLAKTGEGVINFIRTAYTYLADRFPIDDWGQAWTNVGKAISAVWEWMQPFFKWLGEAFQNVKTVVVDFFKTMDFNTLVGLLNVGAIAGVGVVLKKAFDFIKDLFSGGSFGNIKEQIQSIFGAITDTFGAMQAKLKAEALTKIAVAIGLLVAAVVVLSFVDTGKLFIAIGAIGILFTELMAAMIVMEKATASKGFTKMPILAASMIGLATAMVIFSAAVAIMGSLEWDEVARGLVAMAVGLGLMVGGMILLDKVEFSMGRTAGSMILLSTALVLLAAALKIMSSMSWDELARALIALAVGLGAMVGAMKLIEGSASGAGAMIVISLALMVIAGAFAVFGSMSWDDIGRSMVAMIGAVGILVGAMLLLDTMSKVPVGAATMLAMSIAITILSAAMKVFATMSWDDIGRSLVMLAGSLAIMAGAMALMGIPLVALGGLALIVAATGIMLLAPALLLLGGMSWDDIGRGLTMLAGALVILAAGGLIMIPASVGFLLLGAAILLIGTGAYLAGTGMMMFAAGFIALTGAAALGSEAIKMALLTIIGLIPQAMAAFAQGIIDFALVIANGGVEFTAAMTTLMLSLLEAINAVAPQILDTMFNLLMALATKLEENVPVLVEKGGNLIIGVLNGMAAKVPGIARAGTDLMIQLMRAISNEVPRLADEGAKAIVRLINGIANAIDSNAGEMGAAGGRLAAAIVRGMVNGIMGGIGEIINAARSMAESALNAAKNFLGIRSPSREFFEIGEFSAQGNANGLIASSHLVASAAESLGQTALDSTKKILSTIADEVSSEMDMQPSIRPVLDLSSIERDAALVAGLFTSPSLTLDKSVAYANQAKYAGDQAQESANAAEFAHLDTSTRGTVIFNQANYSPKALTSAEIYRKTNNQISVAKKELTTIDT